MASTLTFGPSAPSGPAKPTAPAAPFKTTLMSVSTTYSSSSDGINLVSSKLNINKCMLFLNFQTP